MASAQVLIAFWVVIGALILVAQLTLFHSIIKIYTEILKIEHIKNIGK